MEKPLLKRMLSSPGTVVFWSLFIATIAWMVWYDSTTDPLGDQAKREQKALEIDIEARVIEDAKNKEEQKKQKAKDDAEAQVLKNVEITSSTWRPVDGSILRGNLTVTNRNSFDIKDFKVRCKAFAGSDTVLGTGDNVFYETIPARKVLKLSNLTISNVHTQAKRADCDTVDLKRKVFNKWIDLRAGQ